MAWYDGFKKLNPITWGDDSASQLEQRADVRNQGGMASWYADQAQQGYGQLGTEATAAREALRRIATGQDSVSAEQLRQGLGENLSAQRSLVAAAPPQNAAMAARTAAIQSARLGSGLAGQQAVAGMQERQQAQRALAELILQQRQQDAQTALQSRQTAVNAYGGYKPEGNFIDKYGGAISGAAAIATKSDERAKKDIKGAEKDASRALDGLRAFTFAYKDKRDGDGRQLGVMAQDLERAGLKHAVIDTPDGKYVHGGKLSTTNTAMLAALARRVKKLEGGRGAARRAGKERR